MPICIAGMHRAGTSMVARMVEGCGVDLGGPAHFAPPAPDNRDGYWEDLRFVVLNDRILEKFQGAWDHPPVLAPGWETSADLEAERRDAEAILRWRVEPWGWKDPRNSLTIPFWRSLFPAMRVIICLRNPLEVADSLRARGYTSERFGLSLWEAYYRALEETVDSSFGLVTHYESFLADPGAELDRVMAFLELRPSPGVREAVLASARPGAQHQRRTSAEIEAARWSAAAKRLYAALGERSGPVYEDVQRRERSAPPPSPPPKREEARPRSHEEQVAEVCAVLEAREVELASVKAVLAARDEQLASVLPTLAAREEEIASLKGTLAHREGLPGSLKGVLIAIKKGARTAIKRLVAPTR
jgi:sulfotransferase family protein